ncbi:MAG: nucleoside/nucleotide kinase family protein [Arthrobacter sp.]|nr:nucleoside/nucleotide kinase family protein [Arthrobacter sp.]
MQATDAGQPGTKALLSPEVQQAVTELRLRLAAGSRTLLGIVGAPGSGKSTFAACLSHLLGPGSAVVVPMDGFHLGNAVIDGTALKGRKGAIDTFDVGGYLTLLQRLARADEPVVYAPEFRRSIDEPIAASIAVPADVPLVITEGNYLLADSLRWRQVREQLDEVWFLDSAHALRLTRLVERHILFGKDRAAAEAWAHGSDEANARMIEATRHRADRIIPWS